MKKENDKESEMDGKLSKAKGAKKADGKRVPFREFDPNKYVETEPTIKEGKTKDNVVISFGRMNPPTSGHELLVNKVISTALRANATPLIYLSHSHDPKKNPLSYDDKMRFAKVAFGSVMQTSRARNIIEVAKELSKTYRNLVVVVGSDRVKEFSKLLDKYNGSEYKFDAINVMSAGDRDPDSEGVSGMSASKMRALAREGDEAGFKRGLPKKLQSLSKEVFDAVVSGLNEQVEYEALDRQQRRQRSILMKKLAPKIARKKKIAMKKKAGTDKLQQRAQKQALNVVKKMVAGKKDYNTLSIDQKVKVDDKAKKKGALVQRIAKKLLPKVKAAEKERFARMQQAKSQMASYDPMEEDISKAYGKGLSKSTNAKRQAQFNKQAKMDDDNPAAYKPAPGDAEAKTKTSKHTKNFKKMYGEASEQDLRPRKRYHKALNANNTVKFDGRFKMYKKAVEPKSDELVDETDLNEYAKENPMIMKLKGKKVELLKTGSSFKPTFILTVNGKEQGKFGSEKDAMRHVSKMESTEVESLKEQVDFIFESNPEKSLKKKADQTGISYGILKKVFDRGVAAWKSGHRPGTTPAQWGLARVNSFATGGKTRTTADADLWAKHSGK